MAEIVYSKRLEELLESRVDAAYEQADGTCTAGYDNDGSTGKEIFENGVELGLAMAKANQNAYYGNSGDGAGSVFFVLADSEEAACARVETWEEDSDAGEG